MGTDRWTLEQHGKLPGSFDIRAGNRQVRKEVTCHLFGMAGAGDNCELIKRDIVKFVKKLPNHEVIIRYDPFNCRDHILISNIYGQMTECIFKESGWGNEDQNI